MSVSLPTTSTFDFTIVKGEDFSMDLLIRTKDTHEPIDLSDATFESQCRDHLNSETLLFNFIFTPDADQVANKGEVTMSIGKDVTTDLTESSGAYDVFVTYEIDGARQPFMQGKVTFATAVTRVTV